MQKAPGNRAGAMVLLLLHGTAGLFMGVHDSPLEAAVAVVVAHVVTASPYSLTYLHVLTHLFADLLPHLLTYLLTYSLTHSNTYLFSHNIY